MQAEGWYRDPYLRHDARWYSAGNPTSLVMDNGVTSHDATSLESATPVDLRPAELPSVESPLRAADVPEPILRSGADNPIALRPALKLVRYPVSSWRFPIFGFAGAIFCLGYRSQLEAASIYAAASICLGLVPLMGLRSRINNLLLERDVRRREVSRGDAVYLESEYPPLIGMSDVLAGIVVIIEIGVLIVMITW